MADNDRFDRETEFGIFGGSMYGGQSASDSGPASRQSFRGRGPKNYRRSDERIRDDVCERLEREERIDASDMEVVVGAGVVTLSGSVSDRDSKRRAEDLVESVSG